MNLRTLLIATAATLVCFPADAVRLTPQEALQRANAESTIRKTAPATNAGQYILIEKPVVMHTPEETYTYVFNNSTGNGYLITPADDTFAPVLAYSCGGSISYEKMPEGLKALLSMYDREIASVLNQDIQPNKPVITKSVSNAVNVAPLLQSKWGQNEPYNLQCPNDVGWDINGSWSVQCPTGCVATAMAQIMYYHKWPVQGIGEYSEDTFNWDKMLESYREEHYTEEEANEVAHLMAVCGKAVKMRYSASESGASTPLVVSALGNYFLYEKSTMKTIYRDYTPLVDVSSAIYAELQASRPVLVGADSRAGGHAFILDGCTTDEFFHINWGWDGTCDGYYRLSALEPEQQGTGGGLGAFNYNQQFYIGIQKQLPDPKDYMTGESDLLASGDLIYDVESHYPWETINNQKFCGFTGFLNNSPHYTEFIPGSKLVSTTTGEETIIWENDPYYYVTLDNSGYTSRFRSPRIPTDIAAGEYKLYLIYKTREDDTPKEVRVPLGMKNHVLVSVDERGRSKVIYTEKESNLALAGITVATEIPMGSEQTISLNVINNDTDYYHGDITATIRNIQTGRDVMTAYLMTDLAPEESQDMSVDMTFELDKGEYMIVFTDIREKELATSATFTITDPDLSAMTAIDETNFPDPEFRRWLKRWCDTNGDGYLSLSEKNEITDIYIEDGYDISSLKGIEYLTEVSYLCCRDRRLSDLDVSALGKLWELSVYGNQIESITFGDHPLLENISLSDNKLTSLNVSDMPKLNNLDFTSNQLGTLEIADCPALKNIYGNENPLSSVTLKNLPALEELALTNGTFETIDLSAMPLLKYVNLEFNELKSIDLSQLSRLETLFIGGNHLCCIDLSHNPLLKSFAIYRNSVEVYTVNGKFDMSGLEKYGFDYTRCNRYGNLGLDGKIVDFGDPDDPNRLYEIEYWYLHGGPDIFGIQCPFYLVDLGNDPNSGIDSITNENNISVTYSDGSILVTGTNESLSVYDVAGHSIYEGNDREIPVATGVYVVIINGKGYKVIAR